MLWIRAFLIALLVCLLTLHFLKQLWTHRRYPPGPLPLPVIGGLWRTGFGISQNTAIKLAKQYGKIYTIWIGLLPMVVLSGFQAVKEALIMNSEVFSGRPETPFIKAAFKERGIIFSNGHTWKQQRRFGLVTLRKLGLGKTGLEHRIKEEAQQLVETFAEAKGQPLDPSLPIKNSFSNVISVLTFGQRFSPEDEDFQNLLKSITFVLKFGGSVPHILYELLPWLMKHLPGPQKKVLSLLEEALSFAKKKIEKHKEHQALHDPQDFIDFYLLEMEKAKNDQNSTYNEENLAQCIIEFFVGGTDATGVTLLLALLLMATHPDIQEKVHQEMEDVFGSSSLIYYRDRKKLPYTNAVIHEIQRTRVLLLFGSPRQTTKDINMRGFHIPKVPKR